MRHIAEARDGIAKVAKVAGIERENGKGTTSILGRRRIWDKHSLHRFRNFICVREQFANLPELSVG